MARRVFILVAGAALALTACTSSTPQATPTTASPAPSPTESPTPSPTPAASASPVASPSATKPLPSPSAVAAGYDFGGSVARKAGNSAGGTMLLTAVRTGVHRCFDRVVFEFRPPSGTARLGFRLEYRRPPFTNDPQGDTVRVNGNAFLVVHLEPAAGADLSKPDAPRTYTGPTTINPTGTRYVAQLKETGDFEAVMTWIIGLRSQRPFTATMLHAPQSERLVIDFG